MRYVYPDPEDVGISIAPHVIKERFREGFLHCLKGGQITEVKQLRLSFREGYRAGKFYLRDVRRAQGVSTFPVRGRMKVTAHH